MIQIPEGFHRFAIDLARQAGEIQLRDFGNSGVVRETKDDGSPVTATDTEINSLVITAIQNCFSQVGIRAEEGSALVEGDWEACCDPMDGTISWEVGIPTFAFSLALLHRGNPVFSVINVPHLRRMYTAEAGKGAFLNGQPIQVSQKTSLGEAAIRIGYCSWPGCDYHMLEIVKRLEATGARLINPQSIVSLAALVASGELAATVFPGKTPWDSAAADLLVREAGGSFTSILGESQLYNSDFVAGHLATNGRLHQQILEIIHGAQPE